MASLSQNRQGEVSLIESRTETLVAQAASAINSHSSGSGSTPKLFSFDRQKAGFENRLFAEEYLDKSEFFQKWSELYSSSFAPHFFQSPDWFMCKQSTKNLLVLAQGRDQSFSALSVVRVQKVPGLGRYEYFVDRGPIARSGEALAEHVLFLSHALRRRGVSLSMSPYITASAYPECQESLHAVGALPKKVSGRYVATVLVDLAPSPEAIRRRFRRSLKAQLNKSKRERIRVKRIQTEDQFSEFCDAFLQFKKINPGHFPSGLRPDEFFKRLIEPGRHGACFMATRDSEILAGIMVLSAGRRLIYQSGFSRTQTNKALPLSHKLHWEAIQWAQHQGWQYYDFGGYWLDKGNNDPINRFKSGFSNQIDTLLPEHEISMSPLVARVLRTGRWLKNAKWG